MDRSADQNPGPKRPSGEWRFLESEDGATSDEILAHHLPQGMHLSRLLQNEVRGLLKCSRTLSGAPLGNPIALTG